MGDGCPGCDAKADKERAKRKMERAKQELELANRKMELAKRELELAKRKMEGAISDGSGDGPPAKKLKPHEGDSDSDDDECCCDPRYSVFFCKNGYRIVDFSDEVKTCPYCNKGVSLTVGRCRDFCGCENEDE